jgi:hypothetical protein
MCLMAMNVLDCNECACAEMKRILAQVEFPITCKSHSDASHSPTMPARGYLAVESFQGQLELRAHSAQRPPKSLNLYRYSVCVCVYVCMPVDFRESFWVFGWMNGYSPLMYVSVLWGLKKVIREVQYA